MAPGPVVEAAAEPQVGLEVPSTVQTQKKRSQSQEDRVAIIEDVKDDDEYVDDKDDDSDQEELDKFIAEIEDAADKEYEEAKEKEELGRIRYKNREEFGMEIQPLLPGDRGK